METFARIFHPCLPRPMTRRVCPTAWIVGPDETKYILRSVLRRVCCRFFGVIVEHENMKLIADISFFLLFFPLLSRERKLLNRALAALPSEVFVLTSLASSFNSPPTAQSSF